MSTALATRTVNPFSITKSNHLSDAQIEALWVDVTAPAGFQGRTRPASPTPMYILGGKGSGKTHLMRYHSFELQQLRHEHQGLPLEEGVREDGYLGIYTRCSGLNAARFGGKDQPAEKWDDLFAYYTELWLGLRLLEVCTSLFEAIAGPSGWEVEVSRAIAELFDTPAMPEPSSLGQVIQGLRKLQKNFDLEINNCSFTRTLNVRVTVSRGKLIFGIPRLLKEQVPLLKEVIFVYLLDEFEDLSLNQQKLINAYVRENQLPATFKIGARLYGLKTFEPLSSGEENVEGAEYETLKLDEQFRERRDQYNAFAKSLILSRLQNSGFGLVSPTFSSGQGDWLDAAFASVDETWNSKDLLELVTKHPATERPYLTAFRRHLEIAMRENSAPGIAEGDAVAQVLALLAFSAYPLIEKVNLLIMYQSWFRGKDLLQEAGRVNTAAKQFIDNPKAKSKYRTILDHYRTDLVAQLRRELRGKQLYLGIPSFIRMSEGLPRTLITILKRIYDWAEFAGEQPFRGSPVSIDAQRRGVTDASDWFLTTMRKPGTDGILIRSAIERLAELFRINRFSDKPIECSLVSFSTSEFQANDEARRVMKMAVDRSFLIEVGRQQERNSEKIATKYQINAMLAPRWDLPIARRGVVPLSPEEINAIFDNRLEGEFATLRRDWEDKMSAPFFGRGAGRPSSGSDQGDLFS